ncbi:DUF1207 domain-containing protein [Bacteroidota bacterium]
MKKLFLPLIFFCFGISSRAQTSTELFPDDLIIQSFAANILEPKLGFLFNFGGEDLRLDIGNSIDVVRFSFTQEHTLSIGADLFTYTLLRGEENFHFPVDAVDYLFGINFGYLNTSGSNEWGTRLRISHISAHFVDGHYSPSDNSWRDGRNPQVYSREFIELMPYYKFNNLRLYAGLTYIFHVDPENLGKDNFQVGFDYFLKDKISTSITPFAGYDLKVVNLDKRYANHSISAGVKFGKPNGKGLSIYLHYYSGKSIHGEYFDLNKTYTSLGFNIDL